VTIRALRIASSQNFKYLQDFPSHRIFKHIHKVLNIAK